MNAIQLDRPCLKLQPTEKTALVKIALLTLGISVCIAASSYSIYHFVPKKLFFYCYIATSSFVGFTALSIYEIVKHTKLTSKNAYQHQSIKIGGLSGFKKVHETHTKPERKPVFSPIVANGQLNGIPDDLIAFIFQNLCMPELAHVAQTCKRFRQILEKEIFWKNMLIQDFSCEDVKENEAKKKYRLLYGYKEGIYQEYQLDLSYWNESSIACNSLGNNLILIESKRTREFGTPYISLLRTPGRTISLNDKTYDWNKSTTNFFFIGSEKRITVFSNEFKKTYYLDFPEPEKLDQHLSTVSEISLPSPLEEQGFRRDAIFETDHGWIACGTEVILAFNKETVKFQEALRIGKILNVNLLHGKLYLLLEESKKFVRVDKPSLDSKLHCTFLCEFKHIQTGYTFHPKQEALFYKDKNWFMLSLKDFKTLDTPFFDRFTTLLDRQLSANLDNFAFFFDIGLAITHIKNYQYQAFLRIFDAISCLWQTEILLPDNVRDISFNVLPDGKLVAHLFRSEGIKKITELRVFDFGKFITA